MRSNPLTVVPFGFFLAGKIRICIFEKVSDMTVPGRSPSSLLPVPAKAVSVLIASLEKYHPLTPAVKDFIKTHLHMRKLPRKTFILKSGQACKELCFIYKGIVRGYMLEEEREITTWINTEGELVSSIAALAAQSPSPENIETLSYAEILVLDLEKLNQAYEVFPETNILARKLLQQYYADAENRAFIARLTKAEIKYRYFLNRHPSLSHRVPLKYVASFLGMTLETLSRTRKKKSNTGKFS